MPAKEGGDYDRSEEVRGGDPRTGRRGSKAGGGHSDGQRQIISTVEVADGKGGNSGAGVLSDVIFVNINNQK